jgi:hypothetical protein
MTKQTKRKSKLLIKETINYDLAIPVSDRVAIQTVRLVASNFWQKPTAGAPNSEVHIDCTVKTEADKKNGGVLVFPTFKLNAFDPKRGVDKPDVYIEATFVLVYRAERIGKLKNENFQAFGNTNGIFNAWPYWREYVQNTVTRMGLPPLTIPVFRLTPAKKKAKPTKSKTKP